MDEESDVGVGEDISPVELPYSLRETCRLCGKVGNSERHHLIGRKKIDRDHVTIPLCTHCHDAVDGDLGLHEKILSRRKLRTLLTETEIRFIVETRGAHWLKGNYPSRPVYSTRVEVAA